MEYGRHLSHIRFFQIFAIVYSMCLAYFSGPSDSGVHFFMLIGSCHFCLEPIQCSTCNYAYSVSMYVCGVHFSKFRSLSP